MSIDKFVYDENGEAVGFYGNSEFDEDSPQDVADLWEELMGGHLGRWFFAFQVPKGSEAGVPCFAALLKSRPQHKGVFAHGICSAPVADRPICPASGRCGQGAFCGKAGVEGVHRPGALRRF